MVQSLKKFDFNKEDNTVLIGDLNFDSSATNDLTRYLSMLKFTQIVIYCLSFVRSIFGLQANKAMHQNNNSLSISPLILGQLGISKDQIESDETY